MGAHWPSGGYLSVHTKPIQITDDDDDDNDHYFDGIHNDHYDDDIDHHHDY